MFGLIQLNCTERNEGSSSAVFNDMIKGQEGRADQDMIG